MPRCTCGFVLPEGCPNCPPHIINCPNCGKEVFIEPTTDPILIEILKHKKEQS